MRRWYFFDLDGTVTDSKAGILNAVRHALAAFHIERPEGELLPFIGPPLSASFGEIFPNDPGKVREAIAKYREYFSVKGLFENAVYPGMAELLSDLRQAGYGMCLATSKPEPYTLRILEHFRLMPCFDHVAGAELDGPRNNKADVLRHALKLCGVTDTATCLMIGDRLHDVAGAHAVGMPCVGVLYGYGSRAELEAAGADALCPDIPSLRAMLLPAR